MDKALDSTDWRILDELQRDGRLSYNQLAKRVNLSSPAVAERVRRRGRARPIGVSGGGRGGCRVGAGGAAGGGAGAKARGAGAGWAGGIGPPRIGGGTSLGGWWPPPSIPRHS